MEDFSFWGLFMSDKYKFFRSGLLLTAVGLAMRTVSMFFGAFVSRTVGAEGVGLFTLVMTVYSFAVTLATSGVSLTVTRLVASALGKGEEGEVSRILRGSAVYALFFGALSAVLLFFGADFLGARVLSDARTVSSLKILAFSLVPLSLGAVFSGYFVGVKRVAFNAVTGVLAQGAKIALTVFLVVKMSGNGMVASVAALCLASTFAEIFAFLVAFLQFAADRRRYFGKAEQGIEMKSVCGMALPLGFSAYVRSILLNVEHILIPRKLRERGEATDEAYSHYGTLHGMALPLVTYPMAPLSSFSGLLVPEFSEDLAAGRGERMSRVASKALNTTLAYSIITAVFLYVFAEDLGYVIYSSYDAGYYISTLALIVPIMYLDHVTDSMLKGLGEQVFSMWVNISDSALSVLLVCILIPRMGIMGYALVIVIMEGYNFVLSLGRLTKRVRFKIKLSKCVLLPLLASLISARLVKALFAFGGSSVTAYGLLLKMIFALSVTLGVYVLMELYALKMRMCNEKKEKRIIH